MKRIKENKVTGQYVTKNTQSRERLIKLASEITDEELKLIIYKEGWTIASMLAHLAYWDHWALLLMEKWEKSGVFTLPIADWDTFNDTLLPNDTILPFLLALDPRTAANMAVASAEKIDSKIENAPPEMIDKIARLDDKTRLYRSIHREMHLEEIENLLKNKRGIR
jgi:hypothetical protein